MDDLNRMRVAVHELGHVIAWQVADNTRLTTVRVIGRGANAYGYVNVDAQVRTIDDARGYLAGILAGREAARRWCDENNLIHHEYTCRTDMAAFRQQRRAYDLCRQVPRAEAQAIARRIVRAHWRRILRLAPRLARAGHL